MKKYYEKILVPFIVKYKKDEKLNIIEFLTKKIKLDDDNIPKYIFYLMEQNKEEELKKVLIYDYLDFYPNDSSVMDKIIKIVEKIVNYITFFTSFILLFFGPVCVCIGLNSMIPTITTMIIAKNIQIIQLKASFLNNLVRNPISFS